MIYNLPVKIGNGKFMLLQAYEFASLYKSKMKAFHDKRIMKR